MADIDSLELQITSDVKSAKDGLDALIGTLDTLKTKTQGGLGLSAIASQLGRISAEASKLNGSEGSKLESLAKGLQSLSGLGDMSQLKKLPKVMSELSKVDLNPVKEKMEELAESIRPLADEMQKVANGFSAFPDKIQKFLASSEKVPTSNTKSSRSFANLAAKVTATIYALKRAGTVIASWITKSNEYVENLNLFSVSMGQYAESAMTYANTVSDAMGIDTSDWIRNQGVFMTLATGFGVAGDRAATMSQQLTQLGYDLSSFYNISVEEAMQKLKSGFSGELEPLRNLGYDLSQAKLEAIALSLGIDKSVSSMTQAEKAQLRYYAVMTQVTQVQGDMARTLEDPANQLRIFQAQLQMAARSLGNIFIPALNAILPYAIAAAKVIRYLADAIAGLFGYTFPEMDTSVMNNLETGAGGASDAIDEATENASKLKKTLLGIDELNVMSEASGSGSGADTSGGGGFDFEIPTYDFIGEATNSRVNQIVEEMKEWLGITGEIDSWSDFFNTKLGHILIAVGAIGVAFASWKIATFLSDIGKASKILDTIKTTVKPAASLFLTLAGAVALAVSAFDAFSNGVNWGNLLGMLGGMGAIVGGLAISFGATGAAIGLLVGGLTLLVTGINDALNGSKSLETALAIITGILAIGGGIAILVGGWIPLLVAGIAAAVAMVVMYWDEIVAWVSNAVSVIGQFFVDLWNGIVAVWNTVATWFDTNVIQPVVGFFVGLWEGISTAASVCWNAIVEFFTPAFEWFSALFGSIWQTISDIFYNIGVIASGCWEIIKAVWAVVSEWFDTNIIQPVIAFFTGLWNGISNAAIAAWEGIKAVFSLISGWINTTIIQPVSAFFMGLWDGFLTNARLAWEGVKAVFGAVASFFHDTFKKAWEGIIKVFSTAGEIFVNIKDGILTAFKAIVNGLIKGLNNVIAVPFNGINWVLKMVKDVNIMGFMPFSGIQLISVPQIPYLAQGGLVDSGQLFVARERGPELVANAGGKTAVMNNDQIVESVSRGVYQAVVSAMSSSSGGQVVEAKVNDKVLFEVMVSRARQETVRTGYNPLLGGV